MKRQATIVLTALVAVIAAIALFRERVGNHTMGGDAVASVVGDTPVHAGVANHVAPSKLPSTRRLQGRLVSQDGKAIADGQVCAWPVYESQAVRENGAARNNQAAHENEPAQENRTEDSYGVPLGVLRCATSDATGAFALHDLTATVHVLQARAKEHHANGSGHTRVDLAFRDALDVEVFLFAGAVAVRGRVEDMTGGSVEGALVVSDLGGLAFSGANGAFELWAPRNGFPVLRASAASHGPVEKLTPAPADDVVLRFAPSGAVVGRVVGSGGEDVEVFVRSRGDQQTSIVTQGSFRFDGVSPGKIKLDAVSANFYGYAEGELTLGGTLEIDVKLEPGRVIEGTAVMQESGKPCDTASGELRLGSQWFGIVIARAQGEGGKLRFPAGPLTANAAVLVRCADTAVGEFAVDPAKQPRGGFVWKLPTACTVRGQARDLKGQPIAGGNWGLSWDGGHVGGQSDREGRFEALVPRPAGFEFNHRDFATSDVRMLGECDEPELAITLASGATVSGTTAPLVEVVSVAVFPNGERIRRSTVVADREGKYELRGVPPETVDIVATLGDDSAGLPRALVERRIVAREGESYTVDLPVTVEPGVLEGTVRDRDGIVVDATVSVFGRATDERLVSDSTGRFSLAPAQPGRLRVVVSSRGRVWDQRVDMPPGQKVTLAIDLDATERDKP